MVTSSHDVDDSGSVDSKSNGKGWRFISSSFRANSDTKHLLKTSSADSISNSNNNSNNNNTRKFTRSRSMKQLKKKAITTTTSTKNQKPIDSTQENEETVSLIEHEMLRSQLYASQSTVTAQQSQIDHLNSQIKEKDDTVQNIQQQLHEKDSAIEKLKKQVEAFRHAKTNNDDGDTNNDDEDESSLPKRASSRMQSLDEKRMRKRQMENAHSLGLTKSPDYVATISPGALSARKTLTSKLANSSMSSLNRSLGHLALPIPPPLSDTLPIEIDTAKAPSLAGWIDSSLSLLSTVSRKSSSSAATRTPQSPSRRKRLVSIVKSTRPSDKRPSIDEDQEEEYDQQSQISGSSNALLSPRITGMQRRSSRRRLSNGLRRESSLSSLPSSRRSRRSLSQSSISQQNDLARDENDQDQLSIPPPPPANRSSSFDMEGDKTPPPTRSPLDTSDASAARRKAESGSPSGTISASKRASSLPSSRATSQKLKASDRNVSPKGSSKRPSTSLRSPRAVLEKKTLVQVSSEAKRMFLMDGKNPTEAKSNEVDGTMTTTELATLLAADLSEPQDKFIEDENAPAAKGKSSIEENIPTVEERGSKKEGTKSSEKIRRFSKDGITTSENELIGTMIESQSHMKFRNRSVSPISMMDTEEIKTETLKTSQPGTPNSIIKRGVLDSTRTNRSLDTIESILSTTGSVNRVHRKHHRKPNDHSNLNKEFLRAEFKKNIKKLIIVNLFFQQTALIVLMAQNKVDLRSYSGSFSDLGELFMDDEENVESIKLPRFIPKQHRKVDLPPAPAKTAVSRLPADGSTPKEKKTLKWPDAGESGELLYKVRLLPYYEASQRKELFYSKEEITKFRFEKFMEDHGDEFEIVSDSEEEWDEEEIVYDEELISDESLILVDSSPSTVLPLRRPSL